MQRTLEADKRSQISIFLYCHCYLYLLICVFLRKQHNCYDAVRNHFNFSRSDVQCSNSPEDQKCTVITQTSVWSYSRVHYTGAWINPPWVFMCVPIWVKHYAETSVILIWFLSYIFWDDRFPFFFFSSFFLKWWIRVPRRESTIVT